MLRIQARQFLLASVLATVVFACSASTSNAWWCGWRGGWHWGGVYASSCYYPGYSYGYSCYRPWAYRGCYSWRSCYSPCYTSCYTPCYSSCYYPCYSSCYYPCYSPCYTCYSSPCCCGSVIQYDGTATQKGTVAPAREPMRAPPPEVDPAVPGDTGGGSEAPQGVRNQRSGSTILAVNVPEDAKIYVNGMLTKTPGSQRRYVSRGLTAGLHYTYEIRAEVSRDGKTLTDTRVVQARAGDTTNVSFDFSAQPTQLAAAPVTTTLTVRVPENARVSLAGNDTSSSGSVRQFTTTLLKRGEKWDDYRIVVTVDQDGRQLRREQTISLAAGDSRDVRFDFTEERLALR